MKEIKKLAKSKKPIHQSIFEDAIIIPEIEEKILQMKRGSKLTVLNGFRFVREVLRGCFASEEERKKVINEIKTKIDEYLSGIEKMILDIVKMLSLISYDDRFYPKGLFVYNDNYVRYRVRSIIDGALKSKNSSEETALTLSRFAWIFIDVDFLKITNDFSSMKNGDKLLLKVVEILLGLKDSSHVQEYNLKLAIASLGGDEFAILVEKMDGPLDLGGDIVNGLVYLVKRAVMEINSKDIFDPQDPHVQQAFRKEGIDVPDDLHHITFSVSIGTSSLVLAQEMASQEGDISSILADDSEIDKYGAIINVIMGYFLGVAEHGCKEQKKRNNEARRLSSDPKQRFLYVLIHRTAETRAMAAEMSNFQAELGRKNEIIQQMFSAAKSEGAFRGLGSPDDFTF